MSGRLRAAPAATLVDIVVPVYAGIAPTRACLESVLATVTADQFVYAIDDAGPEAGMRPMLEQLAAAHPNLRLMCNERNLGFVRTANRGFGLNRDRDVILLNSDTLVSGAWVERLRRCAYSRRRVATVTPFTNNGTVCSYPRHLADNPLAGGLAPAALDALFARVNAGGSVAIPTAVGFCTYFRRDGLEDVGPFDELAFGRGYGEECDFSLRAIKRGWANLLCGDCFVYHAGGGSFGPEKRALEVAGHDAVVRKHPDYPRRLSTHFRRDPARPLRRRVDLVRLAAQPRPVILLVSHGQGGGVRRHVEEMPRTFGDRACFLLLEPSGADQLRLSWLDPGEELALYFRVPGEWESLVALLRALPVQRVQIHHLIDLPPAVQELPRALGVPFDFTAHDYYTICPAIRLVDGDGRYCGDPGPQCRGCCTRADSPSWRRRHREFLSRADRVFAPSTDAATRLQRHAQLPVVAAALPDPALAPRDPSPLALPADAALRVLVIGALSREKGADLLEACAIDAGRRGLPLEFHLLGYASRPLAAATAGRLQVTGRYPEHAVQRLIHEAGAQLAWFPAAWPETYSYTLSEALTAGLPVVVPDLGAFAERIAGRPWSWVRPWQAEPEAWNDFFCEIRQRHFVTGLAPAPAVAPHSAAGPHADYCPDLAKQPPRSEFDALRERALTMAYAWRSPLGQAVLAARAELLARATELRNAPALAWLTRRVPIGLQRRIARLIAGRQP